VIAYARNEVPGTQQREQSGGLVEQRSHYFRVHLSALAAVTMPIILSLVS
jgi:hypothetical protein